MNISFYYSMNYLEFSCETISVVLHLPFFFVDYMIIFSVIIDTDIIIQTKHPYSVIYSKYKNDLFEINHGFENFTFLFCFCILV